MVARACLQLLYCVLARLHGRWLLASSAAGSSAHVLWGTSSASPDAAVALSSAPPFAVRHCWKRPATVLGIGARGLKTCAHKHLTIFSSLVKTVTHMYHSHLVARTTTSALYDRILAAALLTCFQHGTFSLPVT